ncbi:MAG: alpha/beta fold hydrolase [Anaerolineae bacterium]|nr:alpha/beta fold hydrolase [Anaerolineae bacterium]
MGQRGSDTITLNDGQFYYEEAGSGQAVVFLHAGIADCRMWDAQFDAFSADYHVVRYDMRGFGRSSTPTAPYAHVADLVALLDHLGIERPILIGASQGGRVALEFALLHPERTAALVLSAPGMRGYDFSDAVANYAEANDAAWEAGDIALATDLDMRMWVDGPRRREEMVDADFRQRARPLVELVYHTASVDVPEQPPELAIVDRLSTIQAPTLVLVGEYDVPDFVNIAGMVAFAVENGSKAMIAGAAHLLPMERPEEFNRHVLAFLKALPR